MEEDSKFVLTVGSRYRIVSMELKDKPLITHGTFKGYTSIGHDDAVVVEMDSNHKDLEGRTRVIPCGMIMSIDVVEVVKEEKKRVPEGMYV